MADTNPKQHVRLSALRTPLILVGVFWLIAIVFWKTIGDIFYLLNFGYIGTSLGVGLGVYALLPKGKKYQGRRLSQLLIGIYMLGLLGFVAHENMQIEGFFLYLLSGILGGAVIHYLVAKVVGPLIFNRGWCSWACWTAMVLDFFPFRRNRDGRLPTRWGNIRYLHFAFSLGLVLALWLGFGYRVQSKGINELYWLLGGNALYYLVAIGLAYALKDNRAFCKYACPITLLLKVGSRFALWKMAIDTDKCNRCGACEKACPMDIRITGYIGKGHRVLSTECIMCLQCENVCVPKALKATWGFDCGTKELLNIRQRIKFRDRE
jgi:ferredoxin-type protein NapH